MPPLIVLLRAVNVGGRNMIAMAALKALLAENGVPDVRTYVQSGNLVLDPAGRSPAEISTLISGLIEGHAGFRPAVIVRTAAEMADVLSRIPFPADASPSRVLVTFLQSDPEPAGLRTLSTYEGPEQVVASGRELFIHYGEDMARSRLARLPLEKLLGTCGTARNLHTIRALVAMAGG